MSSAKREAYKALQRHEILDAAGRLFAREGYEATSIRKIAHKLHCSPGILYHYFEDKDAIMAAIIQETFQKLIERLRPISSDASPIRDRMRRGLRAYVEFGLENPHHYWLLFNNPDDRGTRPKLEEVFNCEGHAAFDCMRNMCREALEQGELRPDLIDSEEVAQTLWMAIHGSISIRIGAKGFPFLEHERLTERMVDVLLNGVLKTG